eukprot:104-Rhodomonas_salina.2
MQGIEPQQEPAMARAMVVLSAQSPAAIANQRSWGGRGPGGKKNGTNDTGYAELKSEEQIVGPGVKYTEIHRRHHDGHGVPVVSEPQARPAAELSPGSQAVTGTEGREADSKSDSRARVCPQAAARAASGGSG